MGKLELALEDYKHYIKKNPEKKRTSPSGLHLGIYRTRPDHNLARRHKCSPYKYHYQPFHRSSMGDSGTTLEKV